VAHRFRVLDQRLYTAERFQGVALSRHEWRPERQFFFLEDGVIINRGFSVHYNLEADYQSSGRFVASCPITVTRSFFTLRVQPARRVTFDFSHSYFRILPTFDSRLIAAGLVDHGDRGQGRVHRLDATRNEPLPPSGAPLDAADLLAQLRDELRPGRGGIALHARSPLRGDEGALSRPGETRHVPRLLHHSGRYLHVRSGSKPV
jgi:hypothetical protein